jgi:hypothetical protein
MWMIVATRQEGKCRFWMRAASDNHGEILTFDCTRAARVIYVLGREIKLLFMLLWIAGFWGELCL